MSNTKNVRLAMIDELVTRNDAHVRMINTRASQSRKPMPDDDRKRCQELRKANTWLGKARYSIVQAIAGADTVEPNPITKPILAVLCHECGATYLGIALAYGVDSQRSQEIMQAVADGDEVFITENVHLEACKCQKPKVDPQSRMDKDICTVCRHCLSCMCGEEFEDCKLKETHG